MIFESTGITFDFRGRLVERCINRSINFSGIEIFFTAYALGSLRLLKLKIEGKTI